MYPNVIFLMIDSFSSKKFHGKEKTSITPTLDKLVSEGTFFEQAISVGSTTVPSYSSVLTGLYPFQCVEKNGNLLLMNSNLKTFIQKFEENKYNVFAELPEIIALSGLNKIFKNYNIFDTFATLYDDVGNTIQQKLTTLKQPWFYYIHLMDLHGAAEINSNPKLTNFNDGKFGKNNYERMVSAMDFWLGKILSKIDFSNTLLIITADHGSPTSEYDSAMEKENKTSNQKRDTSSKLSYRLGHKIVTNFPEFMSPVRKKLSETYTSKKNQSLTKNFQKRLKQIDNIETTSREKRLLENAVMSTGNLYDEVCRIPLLFVGYNVPKNKIIPNQIKNIDIFPTINQILGFETIDNIHGRSLVPLLSDEEFVEESILLQTIPNNDDIKPKIGIRTSDYKYFRNEESKNESLFLFNLKTDPLEENNLPDTESQKIELFEKKILEITNSSSVRKNKSELSQKDMDSAKDLLKKLGYI